MTNAVYTEGQWRGLTERLVASPEQVMIFSGAFWQNCLMLFFFHDAVLQQLLDEQRALASVWLLPAPFWFIFLRQIL